ncbi:MAG: methyltransferase domain-containing protein [Candidatus Velthaea sp.]
MERTDANFSGSIPELYDRYLGPLLFEPYARDLTARVSALGAAHVLEIAAGTGVVTRLLAAAVTPGTHIVATDLNAGMIGLAAAREPSANIRWLRADAMALPFGDAEFDTAVCQFGVMFFPDMERSFREVRRVLVPGGTYLFNVWRDLAHNDVARIVARAAADSFPADPPGFIARTPHGHADPGAITGALKRAGFDEIIYETLELRSRARSWHDCALGLTQGTPLRAEIEARDAKRLAEVAASAAALGEAEFGTGPVDVGMSAHVFTART